jgi:hypothetical protein
LRRTIGDASAPVPYKYHAFAGSKKLLIIPNASQNHHARYLLVTDMRNLKAHVSSIAQSAKGNFSAGILFFVPQRDELLVSQTNFMKFSSVFA